MAANTSPIFPLTPNVGANNVLLSAAMTNTKAFEGTDTAGTALGLVFTAGANGARLDSLKLKYASTTGAVPSGTTNATVAHVFINNGSANTAATNNQFIAAVAIPSTTITTTAAMNEFVIPMNISIPSGYKVYVGLTTAMGATNVAMAATAIGGDY